MHELHLTGADHLQYGDLAVHSAGTLACAMSIGASSQSPSLEFKGELGNEDALSARDDGKRARLVVADSHYGHLASMHLVAALHTADLMTARPELANVAPTNDESETTVTAVWLDRDRGRVQVNWFGDSLALCLRHGRPPQVLIAPNHRFVTSQGFDWADAFEQEIAVETGDLVVAFTDGVNECHYRQPETSIGVARIQAIFEATPNPTSFVQVLGETALAGVDGNPGGQDNIAIAAVLV